MLHASRSSLARCALIAVFFATSCTSPAHTDGGSDSPLIDGSRDVSADVLTMCHADTDCSNGVFCDGEERCMPGASGADHRGCAPPTAPACMSGQTCDEPNARCITRCPLGTDADGDGHRARECGGDDCDDSDSNRYPGNMEVCDAVGHDEDCDPSTFGFRDLDMDGYPDHACCNTDGTAMHCGADCNDSQSNMHPGLAEVCDGLDNDCNGTPDDGVMRTFFVDMDGDGFGVDSATTNRTGCTPPPGFTDHAGDCDDTRSSVHPGAMEICDMAMLDEDCDGTANPPAICACSGDGTRTCMMPGACASGSERCVNGQWGNCSIVPVAESCNGIDDDCDGTVDNGVTITCFPDNDNDGFAAATAIAQAACPVSGRDALGGCPPLQTNRDPSLTGNADCSDTDSTVSPAAMEICNHSDDNCNGIVDEGAQLAFYRDTDLDMRGDPAHAVLDCAAPAGYVANGLDCDDTNPAVFTGAPEICDGIDNNCDPGHLIDDGVPTNIYYQDLDHDLHGNPGVSITSCRQPSGYVLDNTDCGPSGMVDQDSTIYLGALEVCDFKDNNCNGTTDEGASLQTYYLDSDCDGYGAIGATPNGPRCGPPSTTPCYAPNNRDCNDSNSSVNPNASEVCNRVDDNCNGMTDEGLPQNSYYPDCDQDSYGATGATAILGCATPLTAPASCTTCSPVGACWVTRAGDCNDRVGTTHLNATEQCNGVDDDCNGLLDYASAGVFEDADRDGYASIICHGADCDDTRATVHPGATEVIGDLIDENCDGHELCWPDADGDHWGVLGAVSTARTSSNTACNDAGQAPSPTPYVSDCCDTDPHAHPLQTDWFPVQRSGCGGFDFNCSGSYEQQNPSLTTWNCTGLTCGGGSPGWVSSVPACGTFGTYQSNCVHSSICIPINAPIQQACH